MTGIRTNLEVLILYELDESVCRETEFTEENAFKAGWQKVLCEYIKIQIIVK